MKADIILSLIHDGQYWVATGDAVTARGRDLDELDDNLRQAIASSGMFAEGTEVRVRLQMAMDIIPHWMHQYNPSPDYFNRSLTVKV